MQASGHLTRPRSPRARLSLQGLGYWQIFDFAAVKHSSEHSRQTSMSGVLGRVVVFSVSMFATCLCIIPVGSMP